MIARKVMMAFIVMFLLAPDFFSADSYSPSINKLELISDEALQLAKSSRYEEARKMLDYFSDEFLTYTMEESFITADELRIVTLLHQDAVEAVANAGVNHEEKVNELTKFRLAVDALSPKNEPLWVEMEDPMMEAFKKVNGALENRNREEYHQQLNSFLTMYEIIYPSIKLDLSGKGIRQLDARIQYIDEYRNEIFANGGSTELEQLETDLEKLFDRILEDEADPSLWWVMMMTGSIIIATLSYVGWKKFKGAKQEKREKNRQ